MYERKKKESWLLLTMIEKELIIWEKILNKENKCDQITEVGVVKGSFEKQQRNIKNYKQNETRQGSSTI